MNQDNLRNQITIKQVLKTLQQLTQILQKAQQISKQISNNRSYNILGHFIS